LKPRYASVATYAVGGFVGGLVGAAFVIVVTLLLKAGMERVAAQATWIIIVVPLVGLVISVLVLYGIGRQGPLPAPTRADAWRTFPPGSARADITGDVTATAGEEERFPWRLAPLRTLAIFATVGLGGAMGTEAPAAYLGVAAGAWLGDRGRRWRRFLRPAALGGGAAGVAALMGIPLVGTAYILELGRQHHARLSVERLVAALIGGIVGWGIDVLFHLSLIRLVVPHEPPHSFLQAFITALFIGVLAGGITSFAASAIYGAKKWTASPVRRLVLGGLVAGAAAVALAIIAVPTAAAGPGGGAITWAETTTNALPLTLLAVALLRAAITTAAAAAGGCGGIFVPFLAVGDLSGRVFAPGLGIGDDLSGAAGAAGGIAGGYHLPFTAVAMVLGVGGPALSRLTSLATVGVAYIAGEAAKALVEKLKRPPRSDVAPPDRAAAPT
jgi:H+/Cl- antiporter ClcA